MQYSFTNTKERVLKLAENLIDSEKLFGVTHSLCHTKKNGHILMREAMYQCIDTSDFKDPGIDMFGKVASMIFFEMVRCLGWYYHHPEDEEKINQYKSTFLPNKKIAAISTGVASYMTRIMEEQEKAKK